ncbi:MAG: spondin domain-containing protein [Pseudomonadota bacterium]
MSYIFRGGLLATSLLAGAAQATTLEITVTNEQAVGGLYFTPVLSIFHDGTFDTFDSGANASAGLEALAEEGDVSGVQADVAAASSDFQTAVFANGAGFPGAPVIDPGESATLQIDVDTATQRFFSFLSMVIPSNDTFIGNDNPTAYELFDSAGDFVFANAIQVFTTDAWDGGTELDDGNGAAFAPPTGTPATDTNEVVSALANLDFLIGRPQAPGGTVQTASGLLASISINEVAPIPLPAGLPLMLAGLGAFGLLRRRSVGG